jgi:Uma2 family endonuclease
VAIVEQGGVTTRTRYWTRIEYERLVECGVFRPDEPIELVGGRLVVSEPQGSWHAVAVGLASEALRSALGSGWAVREEKPVALDDDSEPEPDLVVVSGTLRDYAMAHPTRPVLVVEVADTSLAWDRREKGSLYARAGIDDYWIVNLIDRVLEVYRNPLRDPSAPHGWRYGSTETVSPPSTVSPLGRPDAIIAIAALLP